MKKENKKLDQLTSKKSKRKLLTFLGIGFGLIAAGTTATILSVFSSTNSDKKPQPQQEFTITFDKGTGTSIKGNTSIKFRQTTTLNSIEIPTVEKQYSFGNVKNYYPFVEWRKTGTEEVFSPNAPITSNLSLTAVYADEAFSKGMKYNTITFENGGKSDIWLTGITRVACFSGRPFSTINKPKVHYDGSAKLTFKGWARKTSPSDIVPETAKITTDITLIPVYAKTIEFNFDATSKGSITSGQPKMNIDVYTSWKDINYPEAKPNDAGMAFEGWYKQEPPDTPTEEWLTSNIWKPDDMIDESQNKAYARFVSATSAEYCATSFVQPDSDPSKKQPSVTYSGSTSTVIKKTNIWVNTPRPLAMASGYIVSSWEYSTNGTTWEELKDTQTMNFSSIYIRPVMSPNVSAIQILGPETIRYGTTEKYSTWTIPTSAPTGASFALYTDPEANNPVAPEDAQVIIDSENPDCCSVQVSDNPSISEMYLKAISSIDLNIKSITKITLQSPLEKSSDFMLYTKLGTDTSPRWYKLSKDELCSTSSAIRPVPVGSETPVDLIPRAEFNQEIYVGENVETIPEGFLNSCSKFNSKIHLSNKTINIENGFLGYCTSFTGYKTNTDGTTEALLDLTNVQNIGKHFLHHCTSFNYSLSIQTYTLEEGFLEGCNKFNSILNLGTNLKTIGSVTGSEYKSMFMFECKAFNQELTLPSSLTSVGDIFMFECDSFCSTLNFKCSPNIFQPNDQSFSSTDSTSKIYQDGFKITATSVADKEKFIKNFPTIPSEFYKSGYYRKIHQVGKQTAFTSVSWSELIKRIKYLEDGNCSEEEFSHSFILSNGNQATKLTDFIGEAKDVTLKYDDVHSFTQKVRVIDVRQDYDSSITPVKYNAFTFQFEDLISAGDMNPGYGLTTMFDGSVSAQSTYANCYLNSNLRKTLTGLGSGKLNWGVSNATDPRGNFTSVSITKTFIEMLPQELQNGLKPAIKNQYTCDSQSIAHPNDKIFLPSATELGITETVSGGGFIQRSSLKRGNSQTGAYQYYTDNASRRIKRVLKVDGEYAFAGLYWTRTEGSQANGSGVKYSYMVNTAGNYFDFNTGAPYGTRRFYQGYIAPAFCL